jgi:hypothetical protein
MTLGRSVLLAPIAWTKDGWAILDKNGRKPLPPEGRVHLSVPVSCSNERIKMYVLEKWVWISENPPRH